MCLLNKSKKLYLLLIFFLFAFGQACFALTLDEAVQTGLENNPDFLEKQTVLQINDAEIKKANNRFNPRIVFETLYREKAYYSYIEQSFETGGKRKQRVKIAKNQKEISKQQLSEEMKALKKQISQAYINHYYNYKRLSIQKKFYETTQKALNIAETKFPATNNLVLSEAEIYQLNSYNNYITALGKFRKSFNDLNYLLGGVLDIKNLPEAPVLDLKNISAIQPDYADLNGKVSSFISQALENSPSLRAFDKSVEKAQKEEKLARLEAVPDAVIDVGPNFSLSEGTQVGVYASLNLEIPVFNHGQADLMMAKANKNKYQKQLSKEKLRIENEVKNLCILIEQYANSKKLYESEMLSKSEKVYNRAIKDFKSGKINVLVYLIAQTAYINTQKNYTEIMENYQKSLQNLEYIISSNTEDL